LYFLLPQPLCSEDRQSIARLSQPDAYERKFDPGNSLQFFPEVTREAGSGQNLTAVGKPKATRSVIYANTDSSKKVTITVDQYMTPHDASAAYHEAVEKSKTVQGFKPIAENVNENVFIGTVSQGRETHIGLGALKDTLVVGATLVGYEPAPETTAKLVLLTGEEETTAKAALGSNAQ
jgi:hypothetical protein